MFNKIDNTHAKVGPAQHEKQKNAAAQHKNADTTARCPILADGHRNTGRSPARAFNPSNSRPLLMHYCGHDIIFDINSATILFFRHFFGLSRGGRHRIVRGKKARPNLQDPDRHAG
jgi:hypothetical protein